MEELIINLDCSSIEDYTKDTEDKVIESHGLLSEKIIRDWFEAKRKECIPIWSELSSIEGFYIDCSSIITPIRKLTLDDEHRNIHASLNQAKSALASSQISQLMPYYGEAVTDKEWSDLEKTKYLITRQGNRLIYAETATHYAFLAFKTSEDRDRFMSREENVKLVESYYMMG